MAIMTDTSRQPVRGDRVRNGSCQEIADGVTEYLDGVLGFRQRMRMYVHLALCRACRNFIRQMQYTVRILQHLPAESISDPMKDELRRRFQEWHGRSGASVTGLEKG